MNFASDNVAGASGPVLEALVNANEGPSPAYGADPLTAEVERRLGDIFEREVSVFLVTTGTAANALAISAAVPPWGLCLCHEESHAIDDECGAPEFFTHGAKLIGLPGTGGKLEASRVESYLAGLSEAPKQMPPRALSISQVTEAGRVYSLEEIAALSEVGRRHRLAVHMDGARFANALVALGTTPAEMTWKRGIDILSFGATKNGCLMAEAIIVFDGALAETLAYRRKRAGQTVSKGRLLAAQFLGYLAKDHWFDNARHANAMAARLAEGLGRIPGVRFAWPCEANEVFPIIPRAVDGALRAAGFVYHPWISRSLSPGEQIGPDEALIRLVASFATREEDVDRFLSIASGSPQSAAKKPSTA
ncbi:threonine aldolase family protein [Microvirga massiliensis]|uniref:threonine aldolase family protein n=1 Tax=Microvirga massiliensis TaxID=1033741 RepID=UPI00062B4DCD|nr:low specificity L-threonine aldolase [Microvirga massiliensis]